MLDLIDKEERKLKKVKINLMRDSQFALWQGVMMVGKTSISDAIPTACTNGRDEIYGRQFIRDLSEKELAFVIMHEASHKAYRHLTTWKKLHDENHHLANAACDYVINLQLKDLDPQERIMQMPMKDGKVMGLIDEKYRGMNTKQVFDLLKKEQEEGGGCGGGFDEHDWEGAEARTEEECKTLEKEIDAALRQGAISAKRAGKGSGTGSRELDDLLAPKIDWRDALREYIKSTFRGKDVPSWGRVNRRFIGQGMYMPTLIGQRVGHLVVGVDTSGSIGGAELAEFMSEVKAIAEEVTPELVDLLYWGSSVVGHETYDMNSLGGLIASTKPMNGGGTDSTCVTQYLRDKALQPECMIMLTDGYVDQNWGGAWDCPVLWVIAGGNDAVAPSGKTIHIKN